MRFLFWTPNDSYEIAAVASKNDCGALILMSEQLFVRNNIGTAFIKMATPEHNFAEQIPGHPIHSIKLRLIPAKRACVGVLLEPMSLAFTA